MKILEWFKKQRHQNLLTHAEELRTMAREQEEAARRHYAAATEYRHQALCKEQQAHGLRK